MIAGIIFALLVTAGVVLFLKPPAVRVEGVPKGFTEEQYETGEVVLNYVEGPDTGPPVLLIPGQMESWHGYKLVLPKLSERYRLFVVDVRGHGKSSHTPGQYSYVQCGEDLRNFIEGVIGEPVVVSGLSSGGVIAAWLAANASDMVRAAVLEDPPVFSSMYPRIAEEKYMAAMFQIAVDTLGTPPEATDSNSNKSEQDDNRDQSGDRDLKQYFLRMGFPREGSDQLMKIPPLFAKGMLWLHFLGRKIRPNNKYDAPLLSFPMRAAFKFLSEYDVDFSAATLDGRLSSGFDPVETPRTITCPILYLHASWSRHKNWGLLGAADDEDIRKVETYVSDLLVVPVKSRHEVHMRQPEIYLEHVMKFLDTL